jgi:hypothetical protein
VEAAWACGRGGMDAGRLLPIKLGIDVGPLLQIVLGMLHAGRRGSPHLLDSCEHGVDGELDHGAERRRTIRDGMARCPACTGVVSGLQNLAEALPFLIILSTKWSPHACILLFFQPTIRKFPSPVLGPTDISGPMRHRVGAGSHAARF